MSNRVQAAQARRENVGAPADRPRQRRCSPEQGAPSVARAPFKGVKVRMGGDDAASELEVSGYATVTERGYEMYDMFGPYTEIVSREAPAIALSSSPDVTLVLNHGGISLARTSSGTLTLAPDDTGLAVAARMDPRMPTVQDVRYALERGDVDEMSFKFRITRGQWSPDYTEYRIEEFDLDRGDVSIVNYGANPFTSVSIARSVDVTALGLSDLRSLRDEVTAEITRRGVKPAMTRNELDLLAAIR